MMRDDVVVKYEEKTKNLKENIMVEHHHTHTHTHTLLLFIMTYLLLKLPYTSLIRESTELIDNLQFSHNYFLGFRSALTMFLQAARRVISKQRNVAIAHRNLRTTAKRKNNVLNQILEGDSGQGHTKHQNVPLYCLWIGSIVSCSTCS